MYLFSLFSSYYSYLGFKDIPCPAQLYIKKRRKQKEIYARARQAERLVTGISRKVVKHLKILPCQRY